MKRLVTISHCTCESDVDTHFLQNHGYCEWCAMIGDFTEEHELDCTCQHCEKLEDEQAFHAHQYRPQRLDEYLAQCEMERNAVFHLDDNTKGWNVLQPIDDLPF